MSDEKYILSFDGECDRLERQSLLFGHDRGFDMVAPKAGTRLLDAGCGSGWLSRLIARRMPDCEVVGVDINPDYVAYAAQKANEAGLDNLSYRVGAVGALPFEAESFDTVWSLMVLMFLSDRSGAIGDLARLVRPGGRLVTGQHGTPRHANAPRNPALEDRIKTFFATAFPDWHPQDTPHLMLQAGLQDIDLRIDVDPMYTFLGAASEAQLRNHREVMTPGAARMADRLGGPAEAMTFVEDVIAFAADPATVTVTGFWTVTGRKP
jgi:ubiquinone/menaquinone biosynthesis C-methylase UbiE